MGRENISSLLKETTEKLLLELSNPVALANGQGGITLFKDENGNDMLLAIDYTNYDTTKNEERNDITVWFNDRKFINACSVDNKPTRKLVGDDGKLDGVVISLRKHESALVKLV